MDIPGKIISRDGIAAIRKRFSAAGKKIVFTNGCFDILHRGHVEYLAKAREFGDALFIGLNSDESVARLKGPGRPIVPQEDRAYLLASLAVVDFVTIFEEATPLAVIELLLPDVLVKGGDYQLDEIVGREVVESNGGKVLTISLIEGRSTSNVIGKIAALAKQGILD